MPNIRIISIRKNTDPRVFSLESEYVQRLRPFAKVHLDDIRQSYSNSLDSTKILEKEADLFDKKLHPQESLVVLHETGKQFTSSGLASWIAKKRDLGKNLTLLIGSAYGIHERIIRKAELVLSLSKMTLTHELARLFLLEALYRSAEITKGSAYHK